MWYIKIFSLLLCLYIFSQVIVQDLNAQTINSDLKTMTKNSEVILVGKVSSKNSSWNKDKTRIYTDVTVEVYEYYKGDIVQNSITVKHLGGEVGEVGELYTHIPTFQEDETVLLFANRDKNDDKYNVTSGQNGKISISMDKNNTKEIVSSNTKLIKLKEQIKSYVKD